VQVIQAQKVCRYYYSNIDEIDPPSLSESFFKWIHRLNNVDDLQEYFRFFEHFGTHFLKGAVFGAKYIYEYKMESSTYEQMMSQGVNVRVAASYSGLISAGGAFNLDSEQRAIGNKFQKNVETSTITIGAPPPSNNDALTWASTVKTSPVPIEYQLSSIENLLSSNYINIPSINVTQIAALIKVYKIEYCYYLRKKALTDNCAELNSQGIVLSKTGLTRLTFE